MNNTTRLLAVGASCALTGFVAGVIVCYIGLQSQRLPVTQGIDDAATDGGRNPTAGNDNARAAKFETLDLDKDGVLSFAEFAGARKPQGAEKWFKLRDQDQDGFISREEFLPFSATPGKIP